MRIVACLVVVTAACSSNDGSVAYSLNGTVRASHAWSGPGDLCCDANNMANVAWQIWFTNTADCPTTMTAAVATFLIIAPDKVTPPSTGLPNLPSLDLTIEVPPATIESPLAYLNDSSNIDSPSGTLTLTTFTPDEVDGTFMAMGKDAADIETTYSGTFTAPACDFIHD
ncbi:MAG TPA: hypothetical protein VGO00_03935 [Kofleriaceae bacterium]|jgi:hypothetical protein|nr:hypothetical protein [Kofleriaceae bacterium]